jgi:hypothetical protein
VLGPAGREIAERKVDIAAQMVGFRQGFRQIGIACFSLGFVEQIECLVIAVEDPHPGSNPEARGATLASSIGQLQSQPVSLDRAGNVTQIVKEFASETGEWIALCRPFRDFQTTCRQFRRPFEVQRPRHLAGGFQIGFRRRRISGPVQVFGLEGRVALGEPARGTLMQRPPPRF